MADEHKALNDAVNQLIGMLGADRVRVISSVEDGLAELDPDPEIAFRPLLDGSVGLTEGEERG